MSQLKVDTITDEAGTGAPNFPNGIAVAGAVQKALFANVQLLTANKTLTTADDRDLLSCSGSIEITLPALQAGLVYGFINKGTDKIVVKAALAATLIGPFEGQVLFEPNDEAILVCDGVKWSVIGGTEKVTIQAIQFSASGSYTPSAGVKSFLACVNGATGGTRNNVSAAKGGSGGGGYSEKVYTAPFASSYTVTIGAGGVEATNTGGTGGTTTFDTISILGSAGATQNGSAGAAGSGGDFNATGGTGGNGSTEGGGGGGAASRAGNGGNGAAGTTTVPGGGGGTGGNNASGATGGAAATADSGSTFSLSAFASGVVFASGSNGTTTQFGGSGAAGTTNYTDPSGALFAVGVGGGGGVAGRAIAFGAGFAGNRGHVTILEFF
jgi:hypothetical protein